MNGFAPLYIQGAELSGKKIDWNYIVHGSKFKDLKDLLTHYYIDENEDPHIIALRYDCSVGSITRKLSELGIKRGRKNISSRWGRYGV